MLCVWAAVLAQNASAQVVTYYAPRPMVTYYAPAPAYYAPITTYYAPRTSYYAGPATAYYAPVVRRAPVPYLGWRARRAYRVWARPVVIPY